MKTRVSYKIRRVYASGSLKARNYIGWLRQVRCPSGGRLRAMQSEVERLDLEKKKKAKFRPPRWPPVISIMERERRKRARRELEWVCALRSSAPEPQKSIRPHACLGGTQFRPPHWPPVISATESLTRQRFRRELERAQTAQARRRKNRGSKPAPVTRATVWKRKKSLEEDKRVLEECGTSRRKREPPGQPCDLCGRPKRMDFGHVTYRGKNFCSKASGRSTADWLAEQRRLAGEGSVRAIPRTTAWNVQQRRQREQKAEELGKDVRDRKRPGYHVCQLCGQPRQKAFGHSRYKGVPFCSAYEGKPVKLWLAEQRTADREGRPVRSQSGRKKV